MMSYNQLVVNKQSGALRVRMRANTSQGKFNSISLLINASTSGSDLPLEENLS
jgi:hypothetical protein